MYQVPGRAAEGADGKVTVKAMFRALHVTRHNAHLSITYLTKEKKQKSEYSIRSAEKSHCHRVFFLSLLNIGKIIQYCAGLLPVENQYLAESCC